MCGCGCVTEVDRASKQHVKLENIVLRLLSKATYINDGFAQSQNEQNSQSFLVYFTTTNLGVHFQFASLEVTLF